MSSHSCRFYTSQNRIYAEFVLNNLSRYDLRLIDFLIIAKLFFAKQKYYQVFNSNNSYVKLYVLKLTIRDLTSKSEGIFCEIFK